MKILSMTATFGKLENAVLRPEQGLGIIEAPNEWGKSTWCAFLTAMFYGMETRTHSTKSALAPKEHYQPWSGSPMAGRIDLVHEGRAITIERSTKGRIPLGQFRAYETESGLDIPGLTAENCGQVLLGVEREVFLRCALVRQGDLPVTQNDALRRRLNALVTTGDESGDAERLREKLSKLKNTIRSNSRNGLLPQAEAQRRELEEKLEEIRDLRLQTELLQQQQQQELRRQAALQNHRQALLYQKSVAARQQLEKVRREEEDLRCQMQEWECRCAELPSSRELEERRSLLLQLQRQKTALYGEFSDISQLPDAPAELFGERDPDRLDRRIRQDQKVREECLTQLAEKQRRLWPLGLVLVALGAVLLLWHPAACAAVALLGAAVLIFDGIRKKRRAERDLKLKLVLADIRNAYGNHAPETWQPLADEYRRRMSLYERAMQRDKDARTRVAQQIEEVNRQLRSLTEGLEPEAFLEKLEQMLQQRGQLAQGQRDLARICAHRDALACLPQENAPEMPDSLEYSPEETEQLLKESDLRCRSIESRIRTLEGRMEAMGDVRALEEKLETLAERIRKLEQMLDAIDLAKKLLEESTQELQRRFAPGLTHRASALFEALTEGRYGRLRMDRELNMLCAAEGEEVLRSVLWRSDGTADQLYLALRLALWEELAPGCPLILDDVTVRFDDKRLLQTLKVLQTLGQERQILLFTCQSREKKLLQ